MCWLNLSLLFFVFLIQHMHHCTEEVQYSHKLVGKQPGDMFGISMATAPGRLIIGVPGSNGGRGSLVVGHEAHVVGPVNKYNFGWNVDVNKEFIVVTGHSPPVYVYEATHPYQLRATLPLDGNHLIDVAIGNKNTIAVVWMNGRSGRYLSIYQYDGHSSWHLAQKLKMEHCSAFSSFPRNLLALSESALVVALPDVDQGHVDVYRKIEGIWTHKQRLQPDGNVSGFGWSIAMDGDHLAVSSNQMVFTYQLNHTSGIWTNNGGLCPPGVDSVAIQNGILVIALTDKKEDPEVGGIVYKLSSNSGNSSYNNESASNTWQQVAFLKTNGDPLDHWAENSAVTVRDKVVFIGRNNHVTKFAGVVFAFDVSRMFEKQA